MVITVTIPLIQHKWVLPVKMTTHTLLYVTPMSVEKPGLAVLV